MTEEDKEPFVKEHEEDKVRYAKEKQDYDTKMAETGEETAEVEVKKGRKTGGPRKQQKRRRKDDSEDDEEDSEDLGKILRTKMIFQNVRKAII